MNFQRRYLVRIIQSFSINVFESCSSRCVFCLSLPAFTFPYAFQFKQGDQHSPSQTPAGQYSSGTFFSFQLGAENHHVHNHRKMLLIVVHVDNDKQEACRSQGRVVELPIVLNWCIHVCKGRIGMGRVIGFVLSEMEGHEIFQKTDEKYPSLPPPPRQFPAN